MCDFADAAIDGIISAFPHHRPGTRPIHAPAITAIGRFQASSVANLHTEAEHFNGAEVRVTMRFSNGTGYPEEADWVPVVRGMAMRFHLGHVTDDHGVLKGERETDMVCMGMPVFFVKTPDRFLELARAAFPHPLRHRSWRRRAKDYYLMRTPVRPLRPGDAEMTEFANGYPPARLSVIMANNPFVPESYATCSYRPVHAFKLTADGRTRWARFTWEPVAGVRPATNVRPDKAHPDRDPYFLTSELPQRLAQGPAEFVLRMQLAEQGDDTSDPTKEWTKAVRKRIVMGHLWIDTVIPDQMHGETTFFNPTALVPGIEPSDDEILLVRGGVYAHSHDLRLAEGPVLLR